MFNAQYLKDRTENNWKTKQVCERLLLSPSQDRDAEASGLHEIAVKRLRARVGNPCTQTRTHADTDN